MSAQSEFSGGQVEVTISDDGDVVRVRQVARTLAVEGNLSLVDQTKMVTAASELARNTLIHGGGGVATLEVVDEGRRRGLRATFRDEGPGIADVQLAMTDGWTTSSGLGLGLSGAQRLVDEFDIDTTPATGTVVTVVKWARS